MGTYCLRLQTGSAWMGTAGSHAALSQYEQELAGALTMMNLQVKQNFWHRLDIGWDVFKNQYQEFIQATESPARLALAFAVGTLTAFLPLIIIDTFLTLFILARFRQLNKVAVFGARAVWNDFVVVPLYVPGFKLGHFLLERILGATAIAPSSKIALTLILGNGLLALTAVMLSFGLVYFAANRYQLNRFQSSYPARNDVELTGVAGVAHARL